MFTLFDPKSPLRIQQGSSLPHWHQSGASYFVTFRTEDSIPADVSRRWHAERTAWFSQHGIASANPDTTLLSDTLRQQYHELFSRAYLQALDKGLGACVLRRPDLRQIVHDSLLHFDSQRYHLGDFVIMPNHVHLIVCVLGHTEIQAQCTSWKRFTARLINKALGVTGRFWQEESFDHLIRSPEQFERTRRYIRDNPKHLPPSDYAYYASPKIDSPVAGTLRVPSHNQNGTRSVPATEDHP